MWKYQNFIFRYKKFSENHTLQTGAFPSLILEEIKRTSQKELRKKLLLTTKHLLKLYKIFGVKKYELKRCKTNINMYFFVYGIFQVQ